MFGHRPDGKRLKKLDPIVQITPYLMPMRCDAPVFLEHLLFLAEERHSSHKVLV